MSREINSMEKYKDKEVLKAEVNNLIDNNGAYNFEITRAARVDEVLSIRIVIDMYQNVDAEKIIV